MQTELRGYARTISEATGVTDPSDLADIEDSMRNDIFHSTLDWQTRDQLAAAARVAWDLVRLCRNPAIVARAQAEMLGGASC